MNTTAQENSGPADIADAGPYSKQHYEPPLADGNFETNLKDTVKPSN